MMFDYELLDENENDGNSEVMNFIVLTVKNMKKSEAVMFGNNLIIV